MHHWDPEGLVCFLTSTTRNRTRFFSDEKLARVVVETIQFLRTRGDYRLYAYVVMPDHFHMLVYPTPGIAIPKMMHAVKGFSSVRINDLLDRHGPLWQKGYHERIIRSENDLLEKMNYIHENPVRAGLVLKPEDYPHSSATGEGVDWEDIAR